MKLRSYQEEVCGGLGSRRAKAASGGQPLVMYVLRLSDTPLYISTAGGRQFVDVEEAPKPIALDTIIGCSIVPQRLPAMTD